MIINIRNKFSSPKQLITFAVAVLVGVLVLLPLMWMFATSLRVPQESLRLPPSLIPKLPLLWSNYGKVFTTLPFFKFFVNSFTVAFVAMCIQLFFSAMAAFALVRIPFKGAQMVLLLILAGMMVPAQVTIIPLFIMMSKIGLYDSLYALILPNMVFPLAVFLLRQFMATIPLSYDEAAYMDGAGRFTIFFQIILPMVRSSLAVAGIMHFLLVWNDFFRPLIFITSQRYMTLPLGLYTLNGFMGNGSTSVILAGVVLSIIPPALLYAFGQKYIIEGTAAGGIKG